MVHDGGPAALRPRVHPRILDDVYEERVPQRGGFRTMLRTYAVPLLLFFAAAVAALVLALR